MIGNNKRNLARPEDTEILCVLDSIVVNLKIAKSVHFNT